MREKLLKPLSGMWVLYRQANIVRCDWWDREILLERGMICPKVIINFSFVLFALMKGVVGSFDVVSLYLNEKL